MGIAAIKKSIEALILKRFGGLLLEDAGRLYGVVTIEIAGTSLPLNLQFPHERRYAIRYVLGAKYPQADIDTMLFRRFVRSGDLLLDAGANIGLTALEALEAGCCRVISFEAHPDLAKRISNLSDPRIEVHSLALTNHSGFVKFVISTNHNQGSTYKTNIVDKFPKVFGATPLELNVQSATVDSLHLPPCDVWKIDIEGAEFDLIEGASRTLTEMPPRVIIVEAFDEGILSLQQLLRASHPYCYRALIDKSRYQLHFTEPKQRFNRRRYQGTSPMYVFLRERLNQLS